MTAVALYRAGVSRLPPVLLALPAFFVTFDHAFPFGSLTFGTFIGVAAWLELAPGRASSSRQPRRVSGTAATKNLSREEHLVIGRIWHGWTRPENADEYERLLKEEIFPGMKERRRAVLMVATVLAAVTLVIAYRIRRMRDDPSALPYEQLLWTEFPRPFVTRARLRELLMLEGNERVLEVGPGTGYYALHVAGWLSPGIALDILDIQQQMLEHTMRRASELGVENIIPTRGDAQELPYQDNAFDAAYLVATLGEIPDQQRALKELRRVLKPGGRLVVGEGQPDPHMVGFQTLQGLAEAAGLAFEQQTGGPLGYFASFNGS